MKMKECLCKKHLTRLKDLKRVKVKLIIQAGDFLICFINPPYYYNNRE